MGRTDLATACMGVMVSHNASYLCSLTRRRSRITSSLTSKSYKLRHSSRGGLSCTRCFRAFSSDVSSLATISRPERSTGPRCFSFGKYCSRVPGGWIGSLLAEMVSFDVSIDRRLRIGDRRTMPAERSDSQYRCRLGNWEGKAYLGRILPCVLEQDAHASRVFRCDCQRSSGQSGVLLRCFAAVLDPIA